jgi:hypothetical protein
LTKIRFGILPLLGLIRKQTNMITQWIKDALRGGDRIVIDYPDGAFFTAKRDKEAFIKYNTGDCVWFRYIDNEFKVCRIDTFDDRRWELQPEN